MTNEIGFLRQVPAKGAAGEPASKYQLDENGEVAIGRDRNCQITLESIAHGMVSRRHATVRPLTQGTLTRWEICDLNSANGTYINGKKLQGCQTLEAGDRISLGLDGPEFIFESPATPYQNKVGLRAPQTGNFAGSEKDALTLTQLFPIASTGKQLTQKAYLYPGIATVIFVVSMFVAVGNPAAFNLLLSAYLAGAAYYFIYQLCGKHKPWWVLLGSALATVLILISPLLMGFILVFREILPGRLPAEGEAISFFPFLTRMFFGAGLMEELLKSLGSRLYTLRNYGTARSQYYPKCHPSSRIRRRTISRIAVANSPHFGFGRRTHGLQRLFGIFYRFERPQTQKALAYFGGRLFQRFYTSRFVECVRSR
jgi:RsiW-degrading membrane proteinase PrsW (M82 family)